MNNSTAYRLFTLLSLCALLIACGPESTDSVSCGDAGQGGQAGEAGQGGQAGEAGQGGQAGEAGQGGQAGDAGQGGQAGEAGQGGQAGETSAFEIIYGDGQHDDSPEVDEATLDANTQANHRLSFQLHSFAADDGGNTMLSAFSVRQAFGLLYPGSKGDTRAEIAEIVGFDTDLDVALKTLNSSTDTLHSRQLPADEANELEAVELTTANAFWGQHDLEWSQDYLNVLIRHFNSGLHALDFINAPQLSRTIINEWVESKTNDRIVELLPENSITTLSRAVLTNAVYFKAPWADSFDSIHTHDEIFTLDDGTTVPVPTMVGTEYGAVFETDDVLVVEKPFRGLKLAMTFVMPKTESLSSLENRIDSALWSELVGQLDPASVDLHLPKFEFETTLTLTEPLEALGLNTLFNRPDLTGMLEQDELTVGSVFHKTFIAIDEGGAEAAAATAIVLDAGGESEPPRLTQINQPFLFAIRDVETGLIVFFGRVLDPR